jgi:hypothetical protein
LLGASSRQRIREVSQPSGEASPSRPGRAHHSGQLQHAVGTQKSATVQRWLKSRKHRHFYFHFTPTSSFFGSIRWNASSP